MLTESFLFIIPFIAIFLKKSTSVHSISFKLLKPLHLFQFV